ncbi:MAG: hypothetical protein JWR09_2339 [Mucilaginibacter sp.]|nr:hypothetical protein [Mucilaginibacter sp.]
MLMVRITQNRLNLSFYKMTRPTTPIYFDKINALLFKIACIFWLIVKLMGWRMWTAYRLFPTAPVFESLDRIPPVIHVILLILSLLFITLLLLFDKNKFIMVGLLMIEIFSCLLDQNRWQPYEYQCLFIIFIFIINTNKPKLVITSFIFILISTYLYSGLGKLNSGFLHTVWVQIILKSFLKFPSNIAGQHYIYYAGYLLGLFELIAGTGLVFSKTKKIAAIALIIMHLFILLLLGPLGLNYNNIVWPWNMVMIVYLYLIFIRRQESVTKFKYVFIGWNKLVFIAWCVLPALHFIGYWDGFLSSSMYSGKAPKMIICIKDTSKCRQLHAFYGKEGYKICNGQAYIELQNWAITETNAIPNPEVRIYKITRKKLEKKYAGAGLSFYYY